MTADQVRQAVAFGLSAVGLGCAVWLVVKAIQEIAAGVRLPRGAR